MCMQYPGTNHTKSALVYIALRHWNCLVGGADIVIDVAREQILCTAFWIQSGMKI